MKIVVTQDLGLNATERTRLEKLGHVTFYDDLAVSPDDWLKRCVGADIICSGKFGLKQKYVELHNVFISVPFVGTSFFDKEILETNNITVSRTPGANSQSVAEYVLAMILNLMRGLPHLINRTDEILKREPKISPFGKNLTVLGHGHVGTKVGKFCEALGMNVRFFDRDDGLHESVANADIVVDTLSANETTYGMLDKGFFASLKRGVYFVTVTSSKIWDADAMLWALDSGILAGVANDCGSVQVRDTTDPLYLKLATHPKVLATPHIAYNTDVTDRDANKMMIDNVESFIAGKPVNLI